jgi:tRNA nucleotidyltransferase (CCA-adding enzyme)
LLAGRLPVPNAFRDLALIAARFHTHCHRATELRDATLVELLDKTDAFRRPERFGQFLLACMADARGRTGFEQEPYPQADYLHQAREAASGIDSAAVARAAEGGDVGEAIRLARVDAVRRWRRAR